VYISKVKCKRIFEGVVLFDTEKDLYRALYVMYINLRVKG